MLDYNCNCKFSTISAVYFEPVFIMQTTHTHAYIGDGAVHKVFIPVSVWWLQDEEVLCYILFVHSMSENNITYFYNDLK